MAEEIATKDNLDDIDDDLEDDIELEDAVDDDVEEEDDEPADTADDEEGSASSGDDDDVDGVGGRASASVAAMEEALLEPVLEILTKISSYYDDLKKIQNQRVEAILAGKSVSSSVEKNIFRLKKNWLN